MNPFYSEGVRIGTGAGGPVEISPDALMNGLLLLSAYGQARRRLTVGLVRELARRWPIWVITNHTHYRYLVDEFIVIRRARLKLNVLRPPQAIDPFAWRARLWESFCGIFGVKGEEAVQGAEILEDVVAEKGAAKATLVDFSKRIVPFVHRPDFSTLVARIADAMKHLAPILKDPSGLDLSGLRSRSVVFELTDLPLRHQAFLTGALLEGEALGGAPGRLNRLIWFDEGALLWRTRWPKPLRSRWIEALGALDRAGLGVAIVTGAASALDPSVYETLGTRIALRRQNQNEEALVMRLVGAGHRSFALLGDDQLMLAQKDTSVHPTIVDLDATLLQELPQSIHNDRLDDIIDIELRALGL